MPAGGEEWLDLRWLLLCVSPEAMFTTACIQFMAVIGCNGLRVDSIQHSVTESFAEHQCLCRMQCPALRT